MGTKNTTLLFIVVCLIVGAIFYLDSKSPKRSVDSVPDVLSQDVSTSNTEKAKLYPLAKELVGVTGFINTPDNKPITLKSLIGKKVILLDIWTYSCINCQRTIPYLNAWYEKYKDQGFVIVGLHVPEFEFEKDYNNVTSAAKKFGITYPVVLDNNSATAREYGMRYWPEEYLIDIDGYIVHKKIGEGGYAETEAKIQALLNERMEVLGESGKIDTSISNVPTVTPQTASPETYFGSWRNQNLGNGVAGKGGVQTFTLPSEFNGNTFYLGGNWDVQYEYAENKSAGATIVFRYKSKEVYFVASSATGVRAKVYSDGVLLTGSNRGKDVDANGTFLIKEDRLYKLIKNPNAEEHTLKIEIESAGVEAYTFTFG